ncbi:hypothetical protein ACX80D_15815 [Arthrobacter sp. Sr24]
MTDLIATATQAEGAETIAVVGPRDPFIVRGPIVVALAHGERLTP